MFGGKMKSYIKFCDNSRKEISNILQKIFWFGVPMTFIKMSLKASKMFIIVGFFDDFGQKVNKGIKFTKYDFLVFSVYFLG